MAQRSYSSAVEEIKSRCNIVDVVSPLVPLKRSGVNYSGCCPFHKEKTPSFFVNDQRQTYHCFGCGAHGDVIKFIQNYYSLSFQEAVERLANQYGIEIDTVYSQQGKKREPYYELNRQAAIYFYKNLKRIPNPGADYVKKRDISEETVKAFGIGYAEDGWRGLTEHMLSIGASESELLELGLCSEKNGRVYDKYRSRLIFPIKNTQNKVIGFGGRIIGNGEPKYLNSSDSLVFQKKYNLYGLNLTRQEIQKEGFSLVVEGYMDLISLYQHGVRNVVATLGTALTPEQAKLLSRYTHQVVLCYDADAAGIKAALRGVDVLRTAGLDVKVLHVDDGKDPDEYIKKHGKDEFLNLVRTKALPDVEYKMSLIARKYDVRKTEESIKFFRAAAGVLRTLPPVEAEIYIKNISSKYGMSEGALRAEVNGTGLETSPPQQRPPAPQEEAAARTSEEPSTNLERLLIRLILVNSDYYQRLRDYPEAVRSSLGIGIMNAYESLYKEGEPFDIEQVRNALDQDELDYFERIYRETLVGEDDGKAFSDCLKAMDRDRRDKRRNELQDALSMADDTVDPGVIRSMMKELQELNRMS